MPVGPGFTQKSARELRQVLDALATDRPPVKGAPLRPKSIWVRPELAAAVEYTAITREGLLRHASFKGLKRPAPGDRHYSGAPMECSHDNACSGSKKKTIPVRAELRLGCCPLRTNRRPILRGRKALVIALLLALGPSSSVIAQGSTKQDNSGSAAAPSATTPTSPGGAATGAPGTPAALGGAATGAGTGTPVRRQPSFGTGSGEHVAASPPALSGWNPADRGRRRLRRRRALRTWEQHTRPDPAQPDRDPVTVAAIVASGRMRVIGASSSATAP